jgi:hypothetical protein
LLGVDEALRRVLEYVPAGCLEVVDVPLRAVRRESLWC